MERRQLSSWLSFTFAGSGDLNAPDKCIIEAVPSEELLAMGSKPQAWKAPAGVGRCALHSIHVVHGYDAAADARRNSRQPLRPVCLRSPAQ